MSHPLSGLRVLDLSRLLPGPFATMVLADLGADVVRVEPLDGGDWLRELVPSGGGDSGAFHALNRNKRSIAVDLRRPEGAAAFLRLARGADAVVESFRPGVLDRLGVGFERLHRENRGLVLCSISGYGQDGPYAHRAGHDLDYCAIAGVLATNGPPDQPVPLGVQVADVAGGAWPAVAGVLAALLGRGATGEGAHVDVSMTEGALAMLALPLGMAFGRGSPITRGEELLDGGAACYGVYRTKDGRFVALGALEPRFFDAFCAAAGRPDLAPRKHEDGHGPREELEQLFAARTFEEWSAFAAEHDVCLAPVLEGDEPRADPQLAARGAFVDVPLPRSRRSMPAVATPIRIRGASRPVPRPGPEVGEHTDLVLLEGGFSRDEIARLRAAGVIGGATGPGSRGPSA
jgi:crotonobetainyl-CoA:carnitine CoA-transferase CaiB-like acyl-CoA transferase